jgi:hypothetical protein
MSEKNEGKRRLLLEGLEEGSDGTGGGDSEGVEED